MEGNLPKAHKQKYLMWRKKNSWQITFATGRRNIEIYDVTLKAKTIIIKTTHVLCWNILLKNNTWKVLLKNNIFPKIHHWKLNEQYIVNNAFPQCTLILYKVLPCILVHFWLAYCATR